MFYYFRNYFQRLKFGLWTAFLNFQAFFHLGSQLYISYNRVILRVPFTFLTYLPLTEVD